MNVQACIRQRMSRAIAWCMQVKQQSVFKEIQTLQDHCNGLPQVVASGLEGIHT